MKNKIFSLLILLLVITASCKKDNNGETLPVPSNSTRIKTITVSDTLGHNLLTMTDSYDNQNRLKKIVYTINDPIQSVANYNIEYYPSKVIVKKNILPDSLITEKTTYELNAQGLASSMTQITYANPYDSLLEKNISCQYNSDGYLVGHVRYYFDLSRPITINYGVADKNYSWVTYSSDNPFESVKYLNDYDNLHVNTVGHHNVGMDFLGTSNYNPVIKVTEDSTYNNRSTCSYQFDSNNRISRLIIHGTLIQEIDNWYNIPQMMLNEVIDYTYY
jgi:hypothetical protein